MFYFLFNLIWTLPVIHVTSFDSRVMVHLGFSELRDYFSFSQMLQRNLETFKHVSANIR